MLQCTRPFGSPQIRCRGERVSHNWLNHQGEMEPCERASREKRSAFSATARMSPMRSRGPLMIQHIRFYENVDRFAPRRNLGVTHRGSVLVGTLIVIALGARRVGTRGLHTLALIASSTSTASTSPTSRSALRFFRSSIRVSPLAVRSATATARCLRACVAIKTNVIDCVAVLLPRCLFRLANASSECRGLGSFPRTTRLVPRPRGCTAPRAAVRASLHASLGPALG